MNCTETNSQHPATSQDDEALEEMKEWLRTLCSDELHVFALMFFLSGSGRNTLATLLTPAFLSWSATYDQSNTSLDEDLVGRCIEEMDQTEASKWITPYSRAVEAKNFVAVEAIQQALVARLAT